VVGLCIGGGQIPLGMAATLLGLFALWALKWFEARLRQERQASISIESDASGPDEAALRRRIEEAGMSIEKSRISLDVAHGSRTIAYDVLDVRLVSDPRPPRLIDELAREPGVVKIQWTL
jgi:putative Mg2+ transporter-C (MgtC) family protein